jgi:DNA-binding transcriptional LysR family regulator
MELRHLRYFIAVAEELNFSRAAEKLHVSQPPLSRQIRVLETELKVKLLDRNRQGVRLTRVGQAVLAQARELVRDAELLRFAAQMISEEAQEELEIGYAPSPTVRIISRVLAQYNEMAPGSRITLHDMTNAEMISGVKSEKIHGGITVRPYAKDMRGLKFEVISQHYPGVICADSSPLSRQLAVLPATVALSKLVVYRKRLFPEYHNWVAKVLNISKGQLNVSQECDDVLSVIAAVESGLGVAVVGDFITPLIGDRVRFVPFVNKEHGLDVGLIYRTRGIGKALRRLILACKASMRSD